MNEFEKLIDIIKTLRGPNGCQWDKEQDINSVKSYLLEETYEVLESIINKNFDDLKEELGDLLCQIVFLSQLANEENQFSIQNVISDINDKLINRHPHVFGDLKTKDTKLILKNWEKIKSEESKKKDRKSIMDGVPKTLPSLTKAYKIQEKASRVGFDWNEAMAAIIKVEEEISELKEAISAKEDTNKKQFIEEELGDLLFSIVNVSRLLSIDPEFTLHKSINKFINRFQFMEKEIKQNKLSFCDLTINTMDEFW
ncbi:MAG: nucleoside triphosphate pyrophosphohydrolase, partial [Spirochaetota bacterium]|nr:nucleoside triphosphate pyrophosphohydrolase [Spirochaetota bacterium]